MRTRVLIAFLMALALPEMAFAQAPQIAAIFPPGGQLGSRVTARIEGVNLAGANAIIISEPGVQVKATGDGKDANGIPISLDIASDAAPGPREIRVITPKGASNPAY